MTLRTRSSRSIAHTHTYTQTHTHTHTHTHPHIINECVCVGVSICCSTIAHTQTHTHTHTHTSMESPQCANMFVQIVLLIYTECCSDVHIVLFTCTCTNSNCKSRLTIMYTCVNICLPIYMCIYIDVYNVHLKWEMVESAPTVTLHM
jgi:hypothetical protein